MSTDSLKDPHGIARIGRLELVTGTTTPQNGERIATTLADRVKMTAALHGGQVHGDTTGQFTTVPGGFLLHLDGKRIYHAGDTALLMDMQLLRGKVDVAILPIGDNFTMGPEDAAEAVGFIDPEVVIPMHYNTWPLIEQDPERFRDLVGDRAKVEVMNPGDVFAP